MKILVFPFSENPYQSLLYEQPEFEKHTVSYLKYDVSNIQVINRIKVFYSLIKYRLEGNSVFHLHWLFNFAPPNATTFTLLINSFYIPCWLLFIKLIGYKIIWTVHNIVPHERTTIADLLTTKIICLLSDKIVLHSEDSLYQLSLICNVVNKSSIIPMGSYNNKFVPSKAANDVRSCLDIKPTSFLFLFFGLIKPYKGLERLLEAFQIVHKDKPSTRLLVTGSFNDEEYERSVSKLIKTAPGVLAIFGHLSDEDLSNYILTCNAVVFPFINITTSSSVIHALAANKIIIAPSIGSITQISSNAGYFYTPNSIDGLIHKMNHAIEQQLQDYMIIANAGKYISSLSWSEAAKKTVKTYIDA